MKRFFSTLIFATFMIFPVSVCAQTSGSTVPPPPYCTSSNPGAIYTNTSTSPATVYTCSYYNLTWQWVINPSYGGLVYYPTLPATCSGALPAFLAGWPNTVEYVCVQGHPQALGGGVGVVGQGTTGQAAIYPSNGNAVQGGTLGLSGGGTAATTASQALANLGALPLSGGTITGNLNVTGAFSAPTASLGPITPTGGSAATSLTNLGGVGKSFANSHSGRASSSALPSLFYALQNYNPQTKPTLLIAGFGSSVSVGATLPDASTQAPVSTFESNLITKLDPGGSYNWQVINMSVNGSTASQFPAAYIEMTTYALNGVTLASGGTGCAVGDWLTVNQGSTTRGGAVIVTSCSGGAVTGIKLSPYVGCLTFADTLTPSTSLYSVASGVATIPGPPSDCSITEQTGIESGVTVNITSVGGYQPVVTYLAYGMNDGGVLQYNGGQTFGGFSRKMTNAIETLKKLQSDVVLATTPHPAIVNYYSTLYPATLPPITQYYPYVVTPITPATVFPTYANSTPTLDAAGLGTPIEVVARYQFINQSMRSLANIEGVPVVDAETYWFAAMECETSATAIPSLACAGTTPLGSQSAAENAFFNASEYVHPNLLGHNLSYDAANSDFVAQIATQTSVLATMDSINGYSGVNIQSNSPSYSFSGLVNKSAPLAAWDIYSSYGDTTIPPLRISPAVGPIDANGNPVDIEAWRVDASTGDWVSKLPTAGYLGTNDVPFNSNCWNKHGDVYGALYGICTYTNYNVAANGTFTFTLPLFGGTNIAHGTVLIGWSQGGTVSGQSSRWDWRVSGGTLYLKQTDQFAYNNIAKFTVSSSGLVLTVTNGATAAAYFTTTITQDAGPGFAGTASSNVPHTTFTDYLNVTTLTSAGILTNDGSGNIGTTVFMATCGTTTTCANTAQANPRTEWGTVTLSSGTATVTGMTAWTSSTSFICNAWDTTTMANPAKAVYASTTSITVTGTGTDVVGYRCTGN